MDKLAKFKELSLIKKIMEEWEKALGVKDKTLAEFLIDLGKNSEKVEDFRDKLLENGAEFEEQSIFEMYDGIK